MTGMCYKASIYREEHNAKYRFSVTFFKFGALKKEGMLDTSNGYQEPCEKIITPRRPDILQKIGIPLGM